MRGAGTFPGVNGKIAFTACRDSTDPRFNCSDGIHVMNADGTGQTRLTNGGGNPSWSPDGGKIVFFSGDFSFEDGVLVVNAEVYVMNADGTGQINLSNDAADERASLPGHQMAAR